MSNATFHQPKGSMCANCIHKLADCSHLDFSKMWPIEKVKNKETSATTMIVRCKGFAPAGKD